MRSAPTATVVLDGFLAARAASAPPATLGGDREVLGWLRQCIESQGAQPVDDLTAYLLTHSTGRLPTDRELAAVLSVVEVVPRFFSHWLPLTVGATAEQMTHAAYVVRLLGRWLVARRLVDEEICDHLARFTSLYDPDDGPTEPTASPVRG